MQDLTVALVQSRQFWEAKETNFKHFETLFSRIPDLGKVDLVILPEMFHTGFSMNAASLAESPEGTAVKWLTHWAGQLGTRIAASLIITENNCFYNRLVVVGEKGIEASYNKRHLFRMARENETYTAGEKRVIYTLKGWRILLQVCYDLRFPVFSRNRLINGDKEYDAALYVANWPKKRAYVWNNLLQARAIENQAYVIGVNRVGEDGNQIRYSGDSQVIDPWGVLVKQVEPHEEKIEIVQLKREVLEHIKTVFPAFLDSDEVNLP